MPGGRPPKIRPAVSDDAIRRVKDIAKEYRKLKEAVAFIPMRRKTMFRMLQVSTEGYAETGRIQYDRETAARIPKEDRSVLLRYEDGMRKIWLLESGVASIEDERTRAIAEDTLVRGKRVVGLTGKYGISSQAIWARKKDAILLIADYLSDRI